MLASALVPEKLSAIRRCPLFGVSAIGRFLKYSIYGKRSWYIAHCPLYGRCPLFGVSAKRGSTVLTMYMIAVQLNDERLVTALQIFKFMRRNRESLAIANVEVVEEEVIFSDVAEAKRHRCQQLRQIWRMSELDRNRAIRRLYLRWLPDKNLDNVEMATDVFKFLLKQIERLERGLDPEEEEVEEEDSEGEVSPSPQWREQYRAWEETARAHRSHRHQHRECLLCMHT